MPFEERVINKRRLIRYKNQKPTCYRCGETIPLALGKTINYLRARHPRAYCDGCLSSILFEVEDEEEER